MVRMVLRKFSEITNKKPIFSQYNIFYNYEHFFFQPAFWCFFNHCQRSQSNQEQCSLCCSSPCFIVLLCTHYGLLQSFSTYFCKLKEIGVLWIMFPDYVISCIVVRNGKTFPFPCDYEYIHRRGEMNSNRYEISFRLKISLRCSVSSLLVLTWIEAKWNSKRYGFHTSHFDRNEISNRRDIFMWTQFTQNEINKRRLARCCV